MADSKISALAAIVGTDVVTSTDVLVLVDSSASANKKILVDEIRIALLSNTVVTNSLGSDVAMTGAYDTGPSCAQGTTGTWWADGTVSIADSTGSNNFDVKLWDGTTAIATCRASTPATSNVTVAVSLSGRIASPAANIRISVKQVSGTNGVIAFNSTGSSKDSTLTVMRIG